MMMTAHLLQRLQHTCQTVDDRPAIRTEAASVSFRAFWQTLNEAVEMLRGPVGVRPGDLVAVRAPRTVDLPIALWSVLAAGACVWPRKEVDESVRLENHGPWWLAREAVAIDAEPLTAASFKCLWPEVRLSSARNARGRAGVAPPGDPVMSDGAYVLTTSGSTGVPNAAVVSWQALGAFVEAMEEKGVFDPPGHTVVWNADPTFDAAVQNWVRTARGDTVYLLSDEERMGGGGLVRALRACAPCVIDATPSHWVQLADDMPLDVLSKVTLLLGGEPFPPTLWRLYGDRAAANRPPRSYNLYGLTEACVNSTATTVEGPDVHVGQPLTGSVAHVLDSRLTPVRDGEVGDVYLSGQQLALGYLEPAVTATTFVANPSGGGTRMLRTRDRGRWRDGSLVILGRTNSQVKIRGRWVDLNRIESIFGAIRGVGATCAVPTVTEEGVCLTVLVQPERTADGARLPRNLRDHAYDALAPWERPDRYELVSRLPLGRTGKIDRRMAARMLSDQTSNVELVEGDVKDVVDVGRVVTDVWHDLLNVAPEGADANFLKDGGHSLTVLRLVNRLHKATGVRLSVRQVYESPTFAEIVGLLERPADTSGELPGEQSVFDDPDGTYHVLKNDEEQFSLWPVHLEIPDGWETVVRSGRRDECLAFVDKHWTDLRPRSLR